MTAISFHRDFVEPIIFQKKVHTVRKWSDHWLRLRLGGGLQLYHGMRTQKCFKIGDTTVSQLCKVRIVVGGRLWVGSDFLGRPVADNEKYQRFAQRDGFEYGYQFFDWIRIHYGLPFRGILIGWWELDPGELPDWWGEDLSPALS